MPPALASSTTTRHSLSPWLALIAAFDASCAPAYSDTHGHADRGHNPALYYALSLHPMPALRPQAQVPVALPSARRRSGRGCPPREHRARSHAACERGTARGATRSSRPAHGRVRARQVEIDPVAKEGADVLELVFDHRRTLERHAPCNHRHALGEPHWPEHLGPEDA